MPLRVIFMGTPDFAVATLMEIVGAGHDVAAVYTQPPRRAGRGLSERPSPVAAAARRFGLDVRTPPSLKNADEQRSFAALDADVAVIVAYGLILPQAFLDAPKMGCLNVHASLLPRWRGAAPIQRAIMAGDTETGVSIMRMEVGLDTGPVAMVERVAIAANMLAGELHDVLAGIGGDLMHRALGALERGSLDFKPQAAENATYAAKIEKREARIDWARSARDVHNQIRGLSPFPGAWFEVQNDDGPQRVKVLRSRLADGSGAPGAIIDDELTVACNSGAVTLVEVQKAGGQAMAAADFLRGNAVPAGTVLA